MSSETNEIKKTVFNYNKWVGKGFTLNHSKYNILLGNYCPVGI